MVVGLPGFSQPEGDGDNSFIECKYHDGNSLQGFVGSGDVVDVGGS